MKGLNNIQTLGQMNQAWTYVQDIIDNLDPPALNQLLSGTQYDLDKLLNILYDETYRVLYPVDTLTPIKTGNFGYLDKLTANVNETFRHLSLSYFAVDVMPDFEMNWHHIEWFNISQLYKKKAIIAARDHSKSWSFTFLKPIWTAYTYDRVKAQTNRNVAIKQERLIITNEYSLAKKFVAAIRDEIEANPILKERLYPKARDNWGKEQIRTKNGAVIIPKSYGMSLRGLHSGSITIDDFLDDSILSSQEQNEKSIAFFKAVISNILPRDGDIDVVGTPFKNDDLYSVLKKSKNWKVFIYPAIFPDGTLLWETRHNLESLLNKKDEQGSIIFSREILCKPVVSGSTIFPYELVSRSFVGMARYTLVKSIYNFPMKFKRVGTGCDFARSANIGADWSVFMTIGVDEFNRYWLLHVWKGKGKTYNEQIGVLKQINQAFRPDVIVMESNAMQSLFVDGAKEAQLPVVGEVTGANKYDLKSGLPGLTILFEQDRIKMPRGDQHSMDVTDSIATQFASITWTSKGKLEGVGAHDDDVMAFWQAIKACNYVGGGLKIDFM